MGFDYGDQEIVPALPGYHPSLSQALALQLTQAYQPEVENIVELERRMARMSLKQRIMSITGKPVELDALGEDFATACHTQSRAVASAGAKRYAVAADYNEAVKLVGMASTPTRASPNARRRPGSSGGQRPSSAGAGASPRRQGRERRAANEEESKTWSGRRHAADILSALHERHVLLEAQMIAASKAAAAEEKEKAQAEKSSAAPRRGSAHGARRRSAQLARVEEVPGAEDGPKRKLQVVILSATGLKPADFGGINQEGTADPYCVCQIPNKSPTKFETSVIKKTLSPQWNETHEILNYCDGDSLSFTVMDWDLDRRELMGQAALQSNEFYPDFSGEVQLYKPNARRGPEHAGALQVRIQVIGADGKPESSSMSGKFGKMLSMLG